MRAEPSRVTVFRPGPEPVKASELDAAVATFGAAGEVPPEPDAVGGCVVAPPVPVVVVVRAAVVVVVGAVVVVVAVPAAGLVVVEPL